MGILHSAWFGLVAQGWNIFWLLVGAALSAAVSFCFYWRSGKDLRQAVAEIKFETAELKKLSVVLSRGLEASGAVEFAKNPDGYPVGIHHKMEAVLVGSGAVVVGSVEVDSIRPADNPPQVG